MHQISPCLLLPFPALCPFRFSIVLFHPLPHQTVREVFPHTAFLLPSQQGISTNRPRVNRSSPCCISFPSVPVDLWKFLSFFPTSPPKKDLRYSRVPSLRSGCVVLTIFTTTDSSATLSPVSLLRLSTYKAYLAPDTSIRDEEGFPS